jgi:hypothetical protein
MKNIIVLLISVLSAFIFYALFSGLTALVFCLEYKDVAQCAPTIVFVGLFSLCTGIFVADNLQNSDLL